MYEILFPGSSEIFTGTKLDVERHLRMRFIINLSLTQSIKWLQKTNIIYTEECSEILEHYAGLEGNFLCIGDRCTTACLQGEDLHSEGKATSSHFPQNVSYCFIWTPLRKKQL